MKINLVILDTFEEYIYRQELGGSKLPDICERYVARKKAEEERKKFEKMLIKNLTVV